MLAPEYGVKNNFDHAISAARRHQKHPNVERKQLEAGETEVANLYLLLSRSSASKALVCGKSREKHETRERYSSEAARNVTEAERIHS